MEKIKESAIVKKSRGFSNDVKRHGSLNQLVITSWLDNKLIHLASNHEVIQPENQCRRWSKKERDLFRGPKTPRSQEI